MTVGTPRPAIPAASARPFRSLVAPLCLAQALVVRTGQRLAAPAERGAKSTPRGARSKAAR